MSQPSSKIYCFNPSSEEGNSSRDRTIFHYTSPDVLIKILSNTEIRFTDCQFLNDRTEFNHMLEPLDAALYQLQPTLHNKDLERVIRAILTTDYKEDVFTLKENSPNGGLGFRLFPSRYYVFCASTDSDSLNMWNYYVKGGSYQGYNIGFSVNNIISSINNDNVDKVMFGPVVYDNKEKITLLKALIRNVDQKIFERSRDNKSSDILTNDSVFMNAILTLGNYRLFFKNKVFEGEKEYRIVILLNLPDEDSLGQDVKKGFSIKNGVVAPHLDLKITQESVKRINLSPMLEHELAMVGIQALLNEKKYKSSVDISSSSIPIRY